MTFVIVMGFHQIIVVMNDVKRHTYIYYFENFKHVCLTTTFLVKWSVADISCSIVQRAVVIVTVRVGAAGFFKIKGIYI